jgi:hypothetical protein
MSLPFAWPCLIALSSDLNLIKVRPTLQTIVVLESIGDTYPEWPSRGGLALMSRVQLDDGARNLALPLVSALRQKQTQFASSSSNGGDVTSELPRHRRHSLLPLR